MIYPQQSKKKEKNQLIMPTITAAPHIFIKLVKHVLTKLIQILSAMKKNPTLPQRSTTIFKV